MNFWNQMKKPILCLAPMADVTDAAFRFIVAKYSKSLRSDLGRISKRSDLGGYVTYTEFVSADGLVLAPEAGRKKLLKNLEYSEIERPIVAQLFTSKPEIMEKAAKLVMELGFDGLDINMGCPDKSVEKQGAGAALIKNPKLAREIIAAAKEGLRSGLKNSQGRTSVPVSVKTRLGYNKDELDLPAGGWLPELLAESPAAIIIHARTRKEMSKVPARWDRIRDAVKIRNDMSRFNLDTQKTLIIGNGDVLSVEDAVKKCEETGADGAMLGRAIFGKPWLFANLASAKQSSQIEHPPKLLAKADYPDREKIIEILIEHIKLFDEKFNPLRRLADGGKSFAIMKKHFKAYLTGDKELRKKMMETESAKEALEMLYSFSTTKL